ncbi:MAG TPA: hypothetical protein QF656_00110 [Nitrosopumilus sp.]|nr:hypothetical protein [Nitrosopumilus sp.]
MNSKNCILTYAWLLLFLFSIFLITPAFAEPIEIEIDWIIEGQFEILPSPFTESIEKKLSFIENEDIFDSSKIIPPAEIYEDFITGSGYVIGQREITIDSEEGQILNQMLIEQKRINKENFFHMIKYLDRYSDGYVELAEALLDPVKKQNYQSSGMSRDSYLNSNLENFLVERGYDLTNVESIPNNAFSPTKYTDIRTAAAKMENDGKGYTDLRELLPDYVKPDSQTMKNEMIRKLSEQTTNVYDSISSSRLEISVKQSPDLFNTINDNLFDDFQFVNTKFENTQHVIDSLEKPQIQFEISDSFDYSVLIYGSVVPMLILIGYFMYRKSIKKRSLEIITVSPSINYVENTLNLIESSRILFENDSKKYAFEKFSQAIRYYYSHKLEINLDLTRTEIMFELKKSNIKNSNKINRWLQLCGQVEFVRYESTQKEFIKALSDFTKLVS